MAIRDQNAERWIAEMAKKTDNPTTSYSREFEGPTIEEAIESGLNQLNVNIKDVEIQVLLEGKKGFLGIDRTGPLCISCDATFCQCQTD